MTPTVYAALIGFLPLGVLLFWLIPPRRALIAVFVAGWLFLPMASFSLPGLPDYGKTMAISVTALLGALIRDSGRVFSVRPSLADLPMLVWCLTPIASSLDNGLGLYDGLSSMTGQMFEWGVPYLLGRAYFTDLASLRELAVGILIGGLAYVPLCWIEIRLSPQLHRWVYGFAQHQFAQTKRYGGYRPMIFMQHGLAVGMWMAAASLMAVWLAMSRAVRSLWGVSMWAYAGTLVTTSLFVKSFGAFALLIMGCATLWASKLGWSRTVLAALAALPLLYMGARATRMWDGEELVAMSESVGGDQRAGSLRFRMNMENVLIRRAFEQPVFGWGGWGRNRPVDDRDGTVTDGLWVIVLGQHGLVGLAAMTGSLMLGVGLFLRRVPSRRWQDPAMAPAAALAVLAVLFVADSLFNAMLNPVFILSAGALPVALASGNAQGRTFGSPTTLSRAVPPRRPVRI